jgi:hypothetical protein
MISQWWLIASLDYQPTIDALIAEGFTPRTAADLTGIDNRPEFDGPPLAYVADRVWNAGALWAARVAEMELFARKNPRPEVRAMIDEIKAVDSPYFWYRCRKLNGRQMLALWPTYLRPQLPRLTPRLSRQEVEGSSLALGQKPLQAYGSAPGQKPRTQSP